jgi:hypothetical protein
MSRSARFLLVVGTIVGLGTMIIILLTSPKPTADHAPGTKASRATTSTTNLAPPPASLSISSWGDSMAAETSQFLGGALRQQPSTEILFASHSFPGVAVCDFINTGAVATDATTVQPQVVAFQFSGDTFTPCGGRLGASATGEQNAQLSADDLRSAIDVYLQQDPRIQHIVVLTLPPAELPAKTYIDLLNTTYRSMVTALADRRVTIANSPAASVSNAKGGFTTSLPCTEEEKVAGVCMGADSTNIVRSPTGHFCVPTSCAGFQPGAWRFANAEASDLLGPYGITLTRTIASGSVS